VVFGWSQWLAQGEPAPPPAGSPPRATSGPAGAGAGAAAPARILLAAEAPPPTADAAPPAVVSMPGAEDPATLGGAAVPLAGAVAVVASTADVQPAAAAAAATRCASMGPFTDRELTAEATTMLQQDGYQPRSRPANGAVPDGYMVVIRGLRSEAEQARVVGRLNRGGLDDAFAIPKLDDGYAVSVGLFSQQRRAERRSQVVANMGFRPEIVERTRPGTVYWLDFDLKTPATGDVDPFAQGADASRRWQVVPCPGTGAGAGPGPGTGAVG
jgi:hypothetical protein